MQFSIGAMFPPDFVVNIWHRWHDLFRNTTIMTWLKLYLLTLRQQMTKASGTHNSPVHDDGLHALPLRRSVPASTEKSHPPHVATTCTACNASFWSYSHQVGKAMCVEVGRFWKSGEERFSKVTFTCVFKIPTFVPISLYYQRLDFEQTGKMQTGNSDSSSLPSNLNAHCFNERMHMKLNHAAQCMRPGCNTQLNHDTIGLEQTWCRGAASSSCTQGVHAFTHTWEEQRGKPLHSVAPFSTRPDAQHTSGLFPTQLPKGARQRRMHTLHVLMWLKVDSPESLWGNGATCGGMHVWITRAAFKASISVMYSHFRESFVVVQHDWL